MRGRGLKLGQTASTEGTPGVAPHAGAWIETSFVVSLVVMTAVAPHAGAWIETARHWICLIAYAVAPHAGAWIETINSDRLQEAIESLPMRGRGLKQKDEIVNIARDGVAPHAGAWIETDEIGITIESMKESLPMRGRGLKQMKIS